MMALSLRCKQFRRLYGYITHRNLSITAKLNQLNKGLVLGVYSSDDLEDGDSGVQLTPTADYFNKLTQGKLIENIKLAGNKVKEGKTLLFWGLHADFNSVAVVGLGKADKKDDDLELMSARKETIRVAASAGCRALDSAGIKDILVEDLGDGEAAAEGSILGTWKFQGYKTKKDKLPTVSLFEKDKDEKSICSWNQGVIKAESQNIARRLADTPANLMTPCIFANEAQNLLKSPSPSITVQVYDKEWAQNENMGAFLAVAQGSVEPPKFLEISYNNKGSGQPIVLIGKGVTFDAGGISLKSAANMDHMRADMSGAANLIGTLYGLNKLSAIGNIKVLIPLTENLPSGTAFKPGDVIKAKNGKTICVDNTDAEGRLILADALCYSAIFKPAWVLDIATLTGAMTVAIGNAATGVFSNSNELYKNLEKAGGVTGDRVWRFPLWKHYKKQVAENTAYDLNNISRQKGGGSCTAAAFLSEFVPEKTPWLHLDMAGVMGPNDSTPYLAAGMTGRPTRTLIEFLLSQCDKLS